MEVERPKSSLKVKKSAAAPESKRPAAKVTNGPSKSAKTKGKAKEADQDEDGMDFEEDGFNMGLLELRRVNREQAAQIEALSRSLEEMTMVLSPENTSREQMLQEQINSLQDLLEKQNGLLELRNSDYTKSRLINRDPATSMDWISLENAETMRDRAVREIEVALERATLNEKNAKETLKKSEEARKLLEKKVEEARRDGERGLVEERRRAAALQRELDAEVANSKKLQAESVRRPLVGAPSSSAGGSTQGSKLVNAARLRELEKKCDVLEGLTGIVIINYTETIQQPGNAKMVAYTCVLSIEQKELPFKLTIWDENRAANGGKDDDEETEHVVYAPGEPIDPSLDLQYLSSTFTFPRSQMAVFYQNMVAVLNGDQTAQVDEEEEEEDG